MCDDRPVNDIRALIARYEALLGDPIALLTEGRRLGDRPHVQADPELALFLGIVLGYVASLEDQKHRLTLLARVALN